MKNTRRAQYCAPLLCFAISFSVYLRTMLPGLGGYGDSSKLQFIGRIVGLPHPTGFPLYVLVNALFSRLPWGTLAWRVNFMSVFFGALTVTAVCTIVSRLTKNPLAALIVSLIFAFSFTFWSVCLVAEVYTFTFFLISLTAYCLIRWRETMHRAWFYLACLVYALSFNHPMVILLIPSFLFIVFATDRRIFRSGRALAGVALIVLVGAAQYLFILLRSSQNPAYTEGVVHSARELVWFVTGASYKRHYFAFSLDQLAKISLPAYGRMLVSQFTFAGVFFAVIGFVLFFLRERVWATFFLLLYVTTVALYVNGPHIEQSIYFVPATMALAVAMGFIFVPFSGRGAARGVVTVALVVVLIANVMKNFAVVDLSGKREYGELADGVLRAVKPRSLILSPDYNWTEILLYKLLGEDARSGDGVFVLHHWTPKKLHEYMRGQVGNFDPYRPSEPLPGKLNIYLLSIGREPRVLKQIQAEGWRTATVFKREPALVKELCSMDDKKILLAATGEGGTPILSFEAFDALRSLGLRAQSSLGDTYGWAAADAVVRYGGNWCGWQYFRFAPVTIRVKRGDEIIKTPYVYPSRIEIISAGYGRGSHNDIFLDGTRVSKSEHGLNLVVADRVSGKLERSINIAPADLQRMQSVYLYELAPGN
jgi:hypothetical protein